METITLRQLHDKTGRWVRYAAVAGGLRIIERGTVVAELLPAAPMPAVPHFARRKLLPAFRRVRQTGGRDATEGISAQRDER